MINWTLARIVVTAVAVLGTILILSCGGESQELSREEVAEIARGEVASAVPSQVPGVSKSEIEQMIQAAISENTVQEEGVSSEEVQKMVEEATSYLASALSEVGPDIAHVLQAMEADIAEISESESGLTLADVQQTVEAAIAGIPDPEPGISQADVQQAIEAAFNAMPEPQMPLTQEEVQSIARHAVASIPSRSAPADYTKFFVENTISRYKSEGLDAALAYYNNIESIDGQWYVFIIDEDNKVIGHYDNKLLGEDLNGPIGTDANGYNFGPEMLSATEEGKWVSYVFSNPDRTNISPGELGDVDLKNAWVVRHDGMLFGSGWYVDVDKFTKEIVATLVDTFNTVGLQDTIELLSSDIGSVLGGVTSSAVSYNASAVAPGEWTIFIANADGNIELHFNPEIIGTSLEDLLGPGVSEIDVDGHWLTSETMRVWAVKSGNWVLGAGWYDNESGN